MSEAKNNLTAVEKEKILQNKGLSSGRSRVGNLNKTTGVIKSLYEKEISKKKPVKKSFFGLSK